MSEGSSTSISEDRPTVYTFSTTDIGEAKRALNAVALEGILWDLVNETRTWLKHGHSFEDADSAIEAIRQRIFDELAEAGIVLG